VKESLTLLKKERNKYDLLSFCFSSILILIYCLDCNTFKLEKNLKKLSKKMEGDQALSTSSSSNLDVVSMVIWLSTGNGKFFELVRKSFEILFYFLIYIKAWYS
jgi:hypothetical protein